jgi:hypothetical protein
MSVIETVRYWYMVLRNAEHYRNICLRVGNDCLMTVLRVTETKGYEYCHLVVKRRLKLMPVADVEAESYVGELFVPSAETGGEKAND